MESILAVGFEAVAKPENRSVFVPSKTGSVPGETFILRLIVPRQPVPLPQIHSSQVHLSVIHSPSVGTCQPVGHNPRASSTHTNCTDGHNQQDWTASLRK